MFVFNRTISRKNAWELEIQRAQRLNDEYSIDWNQLTWWQKRRYFKMLYRDDKLAQKHFRIQQKKQQKQQQKGQPTRYIPKIFAWKFLEISDDTCNRNLAISA